MPQIRFLSGKVSYLNKFYFPSQASKNYLLHKKPKLSLARCSKIKLYMKNLTSEISL